MNHAAGRASVELLGVDHAGSLTVCSVGWAMTGSGRVERWLLRRSIKWPAQNCPTADCPRTVVSLGPHGVTPPLPASRSLLAHNHPHNREYLGIGVDAAESYLPEVLKYENLREHQHNNKENR